MVRDVDGGESEGARAAEHVPGHNDRPEAGSSLGGS